MGVVLVLIYVVISLVLAIGVAALLWAIGMIIFPDFREAVINSKEISEWRKSRDEIN